MKDVCTVKFALVMGLYVKICFYLQFYVLVHSASDEVGDKDVSETHKYRFL